MGIHHISLICLFSQMGGRSRGKLQVRQEIVPQMLSSVANKVRCWGTLHCAVNQVTFLFVHGNSPHAS